MPRLAEIQDDGTDFVEEGKDRMKERTNWHYEAFIKRRNITEIKYCGTGCT